MSDNIDRIHEEPVFRCSSIKKADDEKNQNGHFDLKNGMKKGARKDKKACGKPVLPDGQQTVIDEKGIGSKECIETHPEENRCGNIIDMEA